MKLTDFTKLLTLALTIAVATPGCHKRPGAITPLPGKAGTTVPEASPATPLAGPEAVKTQGTESSPLTTPITDPNIRKDWPRDREIFKSDTVHFDYDSSIVKAGDKPKVSAVADYLKTNPLDAVEIEGYCDERGTEEYNRSLGERRALALREQLISLGVDGTKVDTISYGKDRPVDPGHDEAAWKQNRRGEFILEMHPK
jgi:peptidoglycan-associated lipoprotein